MIQCAEFFERKGPEASWMSASLGGDEFFVKQRPAHQTACRILGGTDEEINLPLFQVRRYPRLVWNDEGKPNTGCLLPEQRNKVRCNNRSRIVGCGNPEHPRACCRIENLRKIGEVA